MTVLNLNGRNSPEALEKPLLFVKRFMAYRHLHGHHPTSLTRCFVWRADEEIKVEGCEPSGPRSQRGDSRDKTVLDPMSVRLRFFSRTWPMSRDWPGFAIEVAREIGESIGPAELGCLGPQGTHRRPGCLAVP